MLRARTSATENSPNLSLVDDVAQHRTYDNSSDLSCADITIICNRVNILRTIVKAASNCGAGFAKPPMESNALLIMAAELT
jgi:hypothetical protein